MKDTTDAGPGELILTVWRYGAFMDWAVDHETWNVVSTNGCDDVYHSKILSIPLLISRYGT
jgi:hypothetical protein